MLFPGDSAFVSFDTLTQIDTTQQEEWQEIQDTLKVPVYVARTYIAKGVQDEINRAPGIFVSCPGPLGSPAIPVRYLNTAGAEVTINGMPFPDNGLYRPYVIGNDLNTIPWEILNDIVLNPGLSSGADLDFKLGRPPDKVNRSDIEVARGPYGYNSSRWRFFRPFGKAYYSYFTAGFKKSKGYIENSDYDGFHVTGGLSRRTKSSEVSLDLWQHRARTGLNSFDFLTTQESRQSREIIRGELHYRRRIRGRVGASVAGLFQRSSQTESGYTNPVKTKLELAGGEAMLADSITGGRLTAGVKYYRLRLLGLYSKKPDVNHFEYLAGGGGGLGFLRYEALIAYLWDENDHGEIAPFVKTWWGETKTASPYLLFSRARRFPDLYLRNFDDLVGGLRLPGFLQSYAFKSVANLAMPVYTQGRLGLETEWGGLEADLGVTMRRVESQIYLSYLADTAGNFSVSPVNFDDKYLELFVRIAGKRGPFSGEISASFRRWPNKYFADGVEKGPAATGFARLSISKELFIRQLFLGGSFQARASSRRDYRAFTDGFTDAFVATYGRIEFRYKDFTFWLNDDNLVNSQYMTWWPYPESARTVWWGLRWVFFD